MITRTKIIKGSYFDSVTLMRVGRELNGMPGVADAAVVMGTAANKNILKNSGLLTRDLAAARDVDLLLAVKAREKASADKALAAAENLLKQASRRTGESGREDKPSSLDAATRILPEANMAVISVAGRYAGPLAMECLRKGLHVMLFSDNVPLEQEIALKKFARSKGLLVMGPDCGTAIINGAPLGFADAVERGPIGVIASAGTGLQEVTCLISNAGSGISQAIGTGGRDIKKDVGGIMMTEGLQALAADPDTKVILIISKPPDPPVMKKILRHVKQIRKPVVTLFLGHPIADGPTDLEEAALMAVEIARGGNMEAVRHRLAERDRDLRARARALASRCRRQQRFIRGLFCGGTFCAEAQVILSSLIKEPLYSNVPAPSVKKLKNSLQSEAHTLLDFGEDEFTVGRPHPMIDFSLRNQRILQEADDPETAIVLLDVVLGYGAHPSPAGELAPVVHKAVRSVHVICSVTGTDRDPQHRGAVERALIEAGAIVMPSNAAACKLAGNVAKLLTT